MPWSKQLPTDGEIEFPPAAGEKSRPVAALGASPELPGSTLPGRVRVGGKYFETAEGQAWLLRGVVYGPFAPASSDGAPFPEAEQIQRDLAEIQALGTNTLRVFDPPPPRLLQAAGETGLRLLVTYPWAQHVDFLADDVLREKVVEGFGKMVRQLRGDARILGFLVGNEVPAEIVRWAGAQRIQRFLERLVVTGRQADPEALFSYSNYPPTEYLQPRNLDFLCYNLYLHQPEDLAAYLRRLQHLAGNMPLVIGEFGMDSAGEGEPAQADYYKAQIREFRHAGVAGEVAFAFTDEWHRGGILVEGWCFGLVTTGRARKPAFAALHGAWTGAAADQAAEWPRVSVIVCAYNAASTLPACLESLARLDYPDFEVLLVDDGSRDTTAEIARRYPKVRYLPKEHAGLSAARNFGAEMAQSEILAYTDADCQVHPLWLRQVVEGLRSGDFAAVGGPNIPPPAHNLTQACVAAAPGGPREVMLDDVQAEHLPGCNLVVQRSAFMHVGGFDPVYHAAGDDVDFCWRLSQCGLRMGFQPGAMVWHERRRSVWAFLRQQWGYGEAEAMLWRWHRQAFAPWGSMRWQGRIYEEGSPETLLPARVYTGRFGEAPFQSIYLRPGRHLLAPTSFERLALSVGWLAVDLAFGNPPIIPAVLFAIALAAALRASVTTHLEGGREGFRARALLAFLCLAQPVVRGASRWFHWFVETRLPPGAAGQIRVEENPARIAGAYWNTRDLTKFDLLRELAAELEGAKVPHTLSDGWQGWDLEIFAGPLTSERILTATEYHGQGANLIRVQRAFRLTFAGGLALVLMLLVCAGLAWQLAPHSALAAVIAAVLPVALGVRFLLNMRALRQVGDAALSRAAQKLGLDPR